MPAQPMPSDTELLDAFEKLLRCRDEMFEFWFDPDASIIFAGEQGGDTLRKAIISLLRSERNEN